MDLNQLLYHHQRAVMRAAGRIPGSSDPHCLIDHYARKIRERLELDAASANPRIWVPVFQ